MVLVGVYHHIVVLACSIQGVAHLHGILNVNIIVGRTVHDKQLRALAQEVCKVDGGVVVITFGVVLWQVVVISV